MGKVRRETIISQAIKSEQTEKKGLPGCFLPVNKKGSGKMWQCAHCSHVNNHKLTYICHSCRKPKEVKRSSCSLNEFNEMKQLREEARRSSVAELQEIVVRPRCSSVLSDSSLKGFKEKRSSIQSLKKSIQDPTQLAQDVEETGSGFWFYVIIFCLIVGVIVILYFDTRCQWFGAVPPPPAPEPPQPEGLASYCASYVWSSNSESVKRRLAHLVI